MIERVARAIQDATDNGSDGGADGAASGMADDISDLGALVARAVIAAMRDYTEAMSQAGGAVGLYESAVVLPIGQSAAERAWLAMIDEALK